MKKKYKKFIQNMEVYSQIKGCFCGPDLHHPNKYIEDITGYKSIPHIDTRDIRQIGYSDCF